MYNPSGIDRRYCRAQGTELHSYPAEIERELERIRGEYNGPIVAVRDLVRIAPDGRMDGVTPVENEVLVVES